MLLIVHNLLTKKVTKVCVRVYKSIKMGAGGEAAADSEKHAFISSNKLLTKQQKTPINER